MVPFDDRDLDQIAGRVRDDAALLYPRFDHLDSGQELRRDHAHDADLLRAGGDPEGGGVERREAHGLAHPLGHLELDVPGRRATLQDLTRVERLQVVEHQDVGLVTGRDHSIGCLDRLLDERRVLARQDLVEVGARRRRRPGVLERMTGDTGGRAATAGDRWPG